ncbi:unnamed protein product [Taenia asiatica]|uniref:Late endosomal/lysosomal adaptor and MAPK and MTOR activator 5 n=1 Tax=Taenia asiatica TaxID=60517 RepID=A0A0R3VXU1_TAEAS|nr:unnamed protein product [Taenia asiatica]
MLLIVSETKNLGAVRCKDEMCTNERNDRICQELEGYARPLKNAIQSYYYCHNTSSWMAALQLRFEIVTTLHLHFTSPTLLVTTKFLAADNLQATFSAVATDSVKIEAVASNGRASLQVK